MLDKDVVLKEDIEDAKERMNAWWEHEIIDRSVFSYYVPLKSASLAALLEALAFSWSLAQNPDGIEQCIGRFEKLIPKVLFGGESIPSYFPNYGAGIMAAVFGVVPEFKTQTMWFNRPTEPDEIVPLLESVKLNANNEWYTRLLRITEYAAKHSHGKYQISMTDLGGVLDILSSFLGPEKLILTIKRQPNVIDTCRAIILEKLLKVYDDLQRIIEKYNDGCNAWLNVWCKKRWYPIQCDFSYMISPKWFRRFVLPDILAQADHMDYAIYHLDGPHQIPFLDDLLAAPQITGIQWVPGDGREPMGHERWLPLYKKIQKAGKNIVQDVSPSRLSFIYKNLDPKGLYARSFFLNESLAKCYLPEFMGGDEGKFIEKSIDWAKEQGKSKLSAEDVNFLLSENHSIYDDKDVRKLVQEINRRLKKMEDESQF